MVTADWEDAPAISSGLPVTLRIGSVGAGLGVGCGVGIGFGGPLNLGLIPGLQQASQGLSAGLTNLSPLLGGTAATVRAAVKGLGVPGLDVGFGCGVGVGYGFGAGLMVKPSVVEQVVKSGTQMMGQAVDAVRSKLPASHLPQQQGTSMSSIAQLHGASSSNSNKLPAIRPYLTAHNSVETASTAEAAQSKLPDMSGMIGSSSSSSTISQALQQQQPQQDMVIMHTLLEQQREIALLKKQNRQLRQAVCKLDPEAPFCGGGDDPSPLKGSRKNASSTAKGRSSKQQSDSSSDWPQ